MKKTSVIIMAACLCIGSLTGCEKTPEQVIVKQKGTDSIKGYESEGEAKGSLGEKVGAPEHYTNEASYEGGSLVIDTDAEIILPAVDSMNTFSVSAKEVNQDMIDTVTKAFFEGDKIYKGWFYHAPTKEWYQEKITELKKNKAEGNLDPYDLGTDEAGNLYYDIDEEIEYREKEYLTAPETAIKKEVVPQFGLECPDSENEKENIILEDSFDGVAETEDGNYDYTIRYALAPDITFKINRIRDDITDSWGALWLEAEWIMDEESENQMSEEEMKAYVDVSYEDALKIAKEKVDKLGWGLELCNWDYAVLYESETGFTKDSIKDSGYIFRFARKVDGAFITSTMQPGGNLEDMDSTLEPWSYEKCDIIVGDDGIQKVEICNPYDIGEIQTENVKLMSFDSIMQIYEQMMEVANADVTSYDEKRIYHIRRIELGYSRIYDPASDNSAGILVPTWDFFGGFDVIWDDMVRNNSGEHSTQSVMTINAIDGTVIDRALGY